MNPMMLGSATDDIIVRGFTTYPAGDKIRHMSGSQLKCVAPAVGLGQGPRQELFHISGAQQEGTW
jgi:hypothetical protein